MLSRCIVEGMISKNKCFQKKDLHTKDAFVHGILGSKQNFVSKGNTKPDWSSIYFKANGYRADLFADVERGDKITLIGDLLQMPTREIDGKCVYGQLYIKVDHIIFHSKARKENSADNSRSVDPNNPFEDLGIQNKESSTFPFDL